MFTYYIKHHILIILHLQVASTDLESQVESAARRVVSGYDEW